MPPESRAARTPPASHIRTGIGYDSHRFGAARPLVLGGVVIPSDTGLVGHSDGDAIAHAVTDAILGACAAGDIGALFPDDDEANRNRDSIRMLATAVEVIGELGWSVANVDVTVIAEHPKIGPHRDRIAETLARTLKVPASAVSVKGKTNEGMGWIGRGEGIACIAVATITGIAK